MLLRVDFGQEGASGLALRLSSLWTEKYFPASFDFQTMQCSSRLLAGRRSLVRSVFELKHRHLDPKQYLIKPLSLYQAHGGR